MKPFEVNIDEEHELNSENSPFLFLKEKSELMPLFIPVM